MSYAAIAERYARAVFELADEAGAVAPITDGIRRFAETYAESGELRGVLENPSVDESSRDALIKDVGARLALPELALTAVRLLSRRRRLGALPEIVRAVTRFADEKAGVVRATVTSAKPLAEDYVTRLTAEIERRMHRKVIVERREDPTLIAGVVTRVGDHTIDGSLRGRLAALERALLMSM